MVSELGRLLFEVKVEHVGEDKKAVLNNKLAIPLGNNKSTFIDIVAWGNTAELIGKSFKKGFEIMVEGTLVNKTRKKDEVEFETVAINVSNFKFTHGNPKENTEEVPDFLK